MTERPHTTDLIDYLDGTLPPDRLVVVRAALAQEPRLRRLIDELGADRDALRQLSPPVLPRDFVAALDHVAATPRSDMRLTTVAPWRRRWVPTAAAAALLLGVGAVVLSRASDFVRWAADRDTGVRVASSDADSTADHVTNLKDERLDPDSAADRLAGVLASPDVLHHAWPAAGLDASRVHVGDGRAIVRGEGRHGSGAATALMIESADVSAVVARLKALTQAAGGQATLVRNFSYADALAMERELVRSGAAGQSSSPQLPARLASVGDAGDVAGVRARRAVLDRMAELVASSATDGPTAPIALGEHLAGPSAKAPTPDQQLEFAERGYAYTLVVPATRLAEVLAACADPGVGNAWLTALVEDGAVPDTERMTTIERWRRWSAVATPTSDSGGDIMLPIRIGPPSR